MSPNKKPLNIAVMGAGLIGERHAKLVAKMPELELCAIIDPAEHSKILAGDLNAPHFYDLDAFFKSNAQSDIKCDGMVVATPNATHLEAALSCFEKGIACLIEKPLAANSKDADAIAKACEKANIPVLVGHHRRHHKVSRILKEKINNGELGQLVGAQLSWMLRKPDDYFEAGKWRLEKGGGPIWINLIHEIDLLRYFMGEIVEVSAFTSNVVRGNGVEDTAIINMRCENGALISAVVSDGTPSPWHFEGGSGENPNIAKTDQDGLRIFGTNASIEFPSLSLWQHANDEGHWGEPIYETKFSENALLGDEVTLTQQLSNFANVIHGTEDALVSAQDGVQSVRVVEAIHRSAIEGSIVKIKI